MGKVRHPIWLAIAAVILLAGVAVALYMPDRVWFPPGAHCPAGACVIVPNVDHRAWLRVTVALLGTTVAVLVALRAWMASTASPTSPA